MMKAAVPEMARASACTLPCAPGLNPLPGRVGDVSNRLSGQLRGRATRCPSATTELALAAEAFACGWTWPPTRLEASPEPQPQPQYTAPQPEPQPQPEARPAAFCPNCGAKNNGEKFCPNCGVPLQ